MVRTRKNSAQRGYDHKWRKARAIYLQKYPLCAHCTNEGYIKAADVVDHITPHKGDMELFWQESNWQPLCYRHHNIKTAREDGGFGNRKSKQKPAFNAQGLPIDKDSHWNR